MAKFKKTPKQARRLWVKALRSGKYEQGKHVLCDVSEGGKPRYCCLGVACELFRKFEGGLGKTTINCRVRFGGPKHGYTEVLPKRVRRWLGLTTKAGESNVQTCLVELNDDCGVSFDQIADIIESAPEGLFTS